MAYYMFTPDGIVEISRAQYIDIKIKELMNEPVEYGAYMQYIDIDTSPERRLPAGV